MSLGTKLAIGVACWGAAKALMNELYPDPDNCKEGDLYGCTVAPVWEEIVFREGFNHSLGPGWGSVLFGAAHVYNQPLDGEFLLRFADTAVCGAALSAVYAQCGLPAAIAAHAAHNAGAWVVREHFERKRRARAEAARRALRAEAQRQRAKFVDVY